MASRIIGSIDLSSYLLKDDLNYINSIVNLREEYDEYSQGHWHNVSLINSTGKVDDTQYRNGQTSLPTHHMGRCQEIARIIQENFDLNGLKMVRTKNLIDGMVIPHRDFIELNKNFQYFRVFVPLEQNLQSFHSDENGVFQMLPGEIWVLDATINHAAVNFSNKSRVLLCLDYAFTDKFNDSSVLKDKSEVAKNDREIYIQRKVMQDGHRQRIVDGLAKIISKFTFKDLLFAVSKFHFLYRVDVTACFDWMEEAASISGDKDVLGKVQALKRYLTETRKLGERFIFSTWGDDVTSAAS